MQYANASALLLPSFHDAESKTPLAKLFIDLGAERVTTEAIFRASKSNAIET
jgi:hypothetical protein